MQRHRGHRHHPGAMKKMPNPGQGLLGSAPALPPHMLPGQGMQRQGSAPPGVQMPNGMMANNGFQGNGHLGNNGQFGNMNQGFRNSNSRMNGGNMAFGNGNQGNSKAMIVGGNNGFENSNSGFGGGNGLPMNNQNGMGFGNGNGVVGNANASGLVNAAMGLGNGLLQRNQQAGNGNSGLLNNLQSQVLAANIQNLNSLSPNSNSSLSDSGITTNQLDSQLSLVNSILKGNLLNNSNNNSMAGLQNMAAARGGQADFGGNVANVNPAMNMANVTNGNNNLNVLQQLGLQAPVNNQMNNMAAAQHGNGGQQQQAAALVAQQMGNMLTQKHQLSMRLNDYAPDAKRMRLDNQGLLGSHPSTTVPPPSLNQGFSSHTGRNAGFSKEHGNHPIGRFGGYNRESRRDGRDSSLNNQERRHFHGHNSPVRREYGRSDRQMDSGQEEYDPAEPTDEVSNMDINFHGSSNHGSGSWTSSSSSPSHSEQHHQRPASHHPHHHHQQHPQRQQHHSTHQHHDRYPISGYDHHISSPSSSSPSSSTSQDQKINNKQQHQQQQQQTAHRNVSRDLSITIDNKGFSDATPSQDDKKDLSSPDQGKSQYFCHACNVDCLHLKNFENHMESARHKMRIDEVLHLHVQKTSQMNDRMRAQVHLRNIENDDRRNDFCSICDKTFYGHVINHRRSQEHKRKERLTKRGCRLCETGSFSKYPAYVLHIDSQSHKKQNKKLERAECKFCSMTFRSPKNFVAHCNTEAHKQKKALLRKDDDNDDSHSHADEDDGVMLDMGDMVTVDATGIFEDEEPPVSSRREGPAQKTSVSPQTPNESAASDKDDAKLQNISNELHETDRVTENDKVNTENSMYNPQQPVGQDYVIPVSGFFCRLCNKFYNDENTARLRHCQSKSHYDKVQAQKKIEKLPQCINNTKKIKPAPEENVLNHMNECKENDIQEPSVEQIVSNNNEKENPNISIHAQHNGLCTEESTLTDCEEDQVCDSSNTLSPKCPLQCRQNVISSNSLLLAPHNCVQEHAV